MAERDQLRRPLRRQRSGHLAYGEHITLCNRLLGDLTECKEQWRVGETCCLIYLPGTVRIRCKELANAPFRSCNSLLQFRLFTNCDRLLHESYHVTVGDSCHTNEHNTRQNRRKECVRVGGRENDDRVGRRLLERLEQRIRRN